MTKKANDLFVLLVVRSVWPGVDHLRTVSDNLLDLSLLLEFDESFPGERAPDLKSLGDDGRSDELVGGDLLQQLVICGLVEEDQVVQLIPGLSLGPLLLLGLTATSSLLLLGGLGRRLRGRLRVLFRTHFGRKLRTKSPMYSA